MTNNVYQLLNDMKVFMEDGPFTNTVSFGDLSDVDLDKSTIFPLAHMNIDNAIITPQTIEFDVNLLCMDILDDNSLDGGEFDYFYGNTNLQDILNSQMSVLQRLHAALTRGHLKDDLLTTEEEISCEPFKDRFANVLAGWQSTIKLIVPNPTGRPNGGDIDGCQ